MAEGVVETFLHETVGTDAQCGGQVPAIVVAIQRNLHAGAALMRLGSRTDCLAKREALDLREHQAAGDDAHVLQRLRQDILDRLKHGLALTPVCGAADLFQLEGGEADQLRWPVMWKDRTASRSDRKSTRL